jgi:hypothetical protein
MTTKKTQTQDISSQFNELMTLVKRQQEQINTLLQGNKTTKAKRTVEESQNLKPYSEKGKVLSAMTLEQRKQYCPKSRYVSKDEPFPLDKKDMIQIFHDNELGGNPWITYSEQIDHFLVPLKTEYKITDAKWKSKLTDMTGHLKGQLIKKQEQLKDKLITDGQRKALNYQIASLNLVINKIAEL